MLSCVDNKIKILLVEDSKTIIEGLEYLLKREGFNVEITINLHGFTGNNPAIYTNKSFGVPGNKNKINIIISTFLGS